METAIQQTTSPTRSSPFSVINSLRLGVLRSQVDEVVALVRLTDRKMAFALTMTPRNLHRLKDDLRVDVEVCVGLLLLETGFIPLILCAF